MNDAKQFHVFRLEENAKAFSHQQQADYYTISLISTYTPGAETMLCFYNPHAPQAGGSLTGKLAGFSCLFNTAFLSAKMQGIIHNLPMFRKGANPVYFLNSGQDACIRELFEKMLAEVNNNYIFKYELLSNYLAAVIHHALKIQSDSSEQ
jgi:AraC family transcriptional activator of pobA